MIGKRIKKLGNFFKVKKPKELNEIEWLEQLHEMVQEWEEKHGKEFPF